MKTAKQAIYWELLVLRCKRGQRQAFEELIRLWERRLFYYVRRLVETEQDAWDVLQQTWVKVLTGVGSLKEPRSLPVWLYRVARNTSMSYWRAKYAEPPRVMDEGRSLSEAEARDEGALFEDAEQVHYALWQLSPAHREVLALFFLQDLSMAQIAEVLGVPAGTVKSRLHHAKRALRHVLER